MDGWILFIFGISEFIHRRCLVNMNMFAPKIGALHMGLKMK
jgi:hypothetical protein